MEETTSLLPSKTHSQSPSEDDEESSSYRATGSRHGSFADSINVNYQDKSSDYNDYSIRVESALSNRDYTDDVSHVTRVYKKRWYVLLVLSVCVTLQNAVWASWGPIAESAKVRARCQNFNHVFYNNLKKYACIYVICSIDSSNLTSYLPHG